MKNYYNILEVSKNASSDESVQCYTTRQILLLEELCKASKQALLAHNQMLAARDSLLAVEGQKCFVPSSARELEDVKIVKSVSGNLPFLFTHQERNGYLSCNISRRYASINMARNLFEICEKISEQCQDFDNKECHECTSEKA